MEDSYWGRLMRDMEVDGHQGFEEITNRGWGFRMRDMQIENEFGFEEQGRWRWQGRGKEAEETEKRKEREDKKYGRVATDHGHN